MGKEHELLEAARIGNMEYIRHYIGKLKHATAHHKTSKKRTIFQSHHTHSYRMTSSVLSARSSALNCRDQNGESLLHLATVNNHKAVVTLLINGGAQVNSHDNQGCLPLHLAAWTGNSDICKALLVPLTINDVNRQNKAGDTSLHIASQYGHTAVVRLLLQHDANPMIRNIRGESSLDLACFYGRLETVSLLINQQPALLQQVQLSHSPLHLASRNGQKEVVRRLLQSGYNINTKTKSGSALHEAATYGKVDVMKLLLQSGIDQSVKDHNNQTVKESLESQNSTVANNLLLVLAGRENPYHSLSSETVSPRQSTTKQTLCKHGKPVKDISTHHRRDRERSSSGQTSDGSSSTHMTPPMSRSSKFTLSEERRSGRQKRACNHQTTTRNHLTTCNHHVPSCKHHVTSRTHEISISNHQISPGSKQQNSSECRHQSSPGSIHQNQTSTNNTHLHCSTQNPPNILHSNSHINCSQSKRCRCQHSKQSIENNPEGHHMATTTALQGKDPQFHRHKSCSAAIQNSSRELPAATHSSGRELPAATHSSGRELPAALVLSGAIISCSSTGTERMRHKSCSAQVTSGNSDYIHLSDTTSSSLPDTSADYHFYNRLSREELSSPDHVYDRMLVATSPSAADDSVYDRVPKPYPIPVKANWSVSDGSPLSPSPLHNLSELYESKDSVYESPGSLSPEFNVLSSRKYLGHIYVNLTSTRSTPDLNKINGEAPKKPPRTPDTRIIENGSKKSSDYACIHINSKSQENITSNVFSPVPSERTMTRLMLSVPPSKSEGHFIFPPTSPSYLVEADDAHDYENMTAIIHQIKSKQPPKIMPRKSKENRVCSPGLDSNSNYSHCSYDQDSQATQLLSPNWTIDELGHADQRQEGSSSQASLELGSEVIRRLSVGGFSPKVVIKMLTQQRVAEDDDDYDAWKQIDGIFSSMGVNGHLTEDTFLTYIKKGVARNGSVGDWLTAIGLGQYENTFIINGYDNINMLNGGVLERDELSLMGIVNTEHVDTILQEIKSLPSVQPINTDKLPASVDEWLSSLDLSQYADNFYNMEYSSMERVLQIWEVELTTVLSVVMPGHQKRIMVSLGDKRSKINTLKREQRQHNSDDTRLIQLDDVAERDVRGFTPLNGCSRLTHQVNDSPALIRSKSPMAASLERSDSGCSIGSDGTMRPDATDSTDVTHSSLASYDRSQIAKQLTGSIGPLYPTMADKRQNGTVDPSAYLTDDELTDADSADADYANIAEFTKALLIGDIEGLKLSQKNAPKKTHRPLPDLPPHDSSLPFTADDLSADFAGNKKLITGSVNYKSCYLGTCLVNDITGPESTREAIAKLKRVSGGVTKLPSVSLSISSSGVKFIEDATMRIICEHEITNIYCAAQDSQRLNYFAYITKDMLTQGLYCHVFCAQSEELARQILMTLGEAFSLAYSASTAADSKAIN